MRIDPRLLLTVAFLAMPMTVRAAPADTQAQSVDEAVVYIECNKAGSPTSKGTGVLVSPEGVILTAGHVAPAGYVCKGAPNATVSLRALTRVPRQTGVDAMLLRYTPLPHETFPWVKFCKLTQDLKGKPIVATGFTGGNNPGEASIRNGVISTVTPNENGVIQTSVQTTEGMSGGPVTYGEGTNLIGIVAGAEFDAATGQPISFGVLAADLLSDNLKLVAADSCEISHSDVNPDNLPHPNINVTANHGIAAGHDAIGNTINNTVNKN